jgi:hypothetical protein
VASYGEMVQVIQDKDYSDLNTEHHTVCLLVPVVVLLTDPGGSLRGFL